MIARLDGRDFTRLTKEIHEFEGKDEGIEQDIEIGENNNNRSIAVIMKGKGYPLEERGILFV